jgi:osmotically-inducible protein OsmY
MRAAAALALACGLLQGCGLALLGAGGTVAYTTIEDRRSTGTQLDDEAIGRRASVRIDERFGNQVHVNITVYNRAVLLTGEVPDDAVRAGVERVVLAVPNVRGATNELQLSGASSLGARTNDSYLTSKVKARFLEAKRFKPVHVKVVTESGVVYLLGVVTDREAEEAADIARTTGGVRKVVKIFEYCKSSHEMCQPQSPSPGARTKPSA